VRYRAKSQQEAWEANSLKKVAPGERSAKQADLHSKRLRLALHKAANRIELNVEKDQREGECCLNGFNPESIGCSCYWIV
jgi:uncharacterized lipoprotein